MNKKIYNGAAVLLVLMFLFSSCAIYTPDESYSGKVSTINAASNTYPGTTTSTPLTGGSATVVPVATLIPVVLNYITMSVEDSGYVFYGVNGTRIAEWVFQPSGDIIKKGRVINGLVKVFYAPDLVAAEIYYKNNFRDGSYIRYFRDGKINTHGNYKHGEKYGSWKSFMPDGSVEQDAFYQKADNAEIYYKTKINPSYIYEPIWAYIDREDDPKSTAAAENKVQ